MYFELVLADRHVVLVQVVGEVDRASQCLVVINRREPLLDDRVNRFIAPVLLILENQAILVKAQAFVNHESDEVLRLFKRLKRFINSILPAGQLSRRVDVVRLLVSSVVPLRACIEVNHGFRHGVCVRT